jgi:hypothetical protein
MKIFIDTKKIKKVDLETYYKTYSVYDSRGHFVGMMKNTPLVINVEGHYFYLDDICNNITDINTKNTVEMFIRCCKRGETNEKKIPNIVFRLLR